MVLIIMYARLGFGRRHSFVKWAICPAGTRARLSLYLASIHVWNDDGVREEESPNFTRVHLSQWTMEPYQWEEIASSMPKSLYAVIIMFSRWRNPISWYYRIIYIEFSLILKNCRDKDSFPEYIVPAEIQRTKNPDEFATGCAGTQFTNGVKLNFVAICWAGCYEYTKELSRLSSEWVYAGWGKSLLTALL